MEAGFLRAGRCWSGKFQYARRMETSLLTAYRAKRRVAGLAAPACRLESPTLFCGIHGAAPKKKTATPRCGNTATPARRESCKPNAAARSSVADFTGIKDAA